MFAAVVGLAGILPAGAHAAQPSYFANEAAVAVAGPSMVYLEATYSGVIRDTAGGQPIHAETVQFTRRCSGVVVGAGGEAITTSVCIRPSEDIVLVNALYRLARQMVSRNELPAGELDAYVEKVRSTTRFTGEDPAAGPQITVTAQVGMSNPATASPRPAVVTHAQPAVEGNLALVKMETAGLPVVEVAPAAELRPGMPVVIMGYATVQDGIALQHKSVQVTGPTGTNRLGVNQELGPDARGAAVLDTDGHLIAILDSDSTAAGNPTHDLIGAYNINRLLLEGNVDNRLSETDVAYRAALDAYFGGRFSQATVRLDAVLASRPDGFTQTYRQRAQERLETDGDAEEDAADWMLYAICIGLGIAVILGVDFIRSLAKPKRKKRIHAAAAKPRATPAPPTGPVGWPQPSAHQRPDDTVVMVALAENTLALPHLASDQTMVLRVGDIDDTVVHSRTPGEPITAYLPRIPGPKAFDDYDDGARS